MTAFTHKSRQATGPFALLRIKRLELAAMDDLHLYTGCVHAGEPEVNDRRGGLDRGLAATCWYA